MRVIAPALQFLLQFKIVLFFLFRRLLLFPCPAFLYFELQWFDLLAVYFTNTRQLTLILGSYCRSKYPTRYYVAVIDIILSNKMAVMRRRYWLATQREREREREREEKRRETERERREREGKKERTAEK